MGWCCKRDRPDRDDRAPRWALMLFEGVNHKLDGLRQQLKTTQELIMAAVQIEQGDLDAVAAALEALVGVIAGIDTTVLPPADESALNAALADVTTAINDKLPVSTPVTPPVDAGTGDAPTDGSA